MKVLICGGSSLLGKYLIRSSMPKHRIETTWYTNYVPGYTNYQMDVGNKSQIAYVLSRVKPDIIIHCAANGNVDFSENNYREAYQVNVVGTENIINAAREINAKVVYISTNAVFSGDAPPYTEYSIRSPANRYGSIKKQAEDKVIASKKWIVVRPYMLYGWPNTNGRQNWMSTTIDRLSEGKSMTIINDIFWQPTSASCCAKAIWKLIEMGVGEEAFNIAADTSMSLCDFCKIVAKIWKLDPDLIKPVDSNYFEKLYPKMAKRPINTQFDLTKIKDLGIKILNVKAGLKEMKKEVG